MYLDRDGKPRYDRPPELCDNGKSAHLGKPIVTPACFRGTEATQRVTVIYNDVEETTLNLCDACAKLLKNSARRHGYKVKTSRIQRR